MNLLLQRLWNLKISFLVCWYLQLIICSSHKWEWMVLKEYSVILNTPFYGHESEDINKKAYFQNFSWFQFYVYKLCKIIRHCSMSKVTHPPDQSLTEYVSDVLLCWYTCPLVVFKMWQLYIYKTINLHKFLNQKLFYQYYFLTNISCNISYFSHFKTFTSSQAQLQVG